MPRKWMVFSWDEIDGRWVWQCSRYGPDAQAAFDLYRTGKLSLRAKYYKVEPEASLPVFFTYVPPSTGEWKAKLTDPTGGE